MNNGIKGMGCFETKWGRTPANRLGREYNVITWYTARIGQGGTGNSLFAVTPRPGTRGEDQGG